MSYHRYNAGRKLLNQLSEFENELLEAVEPVLWRMREICAEQGAMKKLPKKQRAKLYFSLRDGALHSDYEFLDNCIGLTDLHSDYGEIIDEVIGLNFAETEGLPASWLWTKSWEQEFVEEWIGRWKKEKLKAEIAQEEADRAQFERLKKKFKGKPVKSTVFSGNELRSFIKELEKKQ